MSILIKNGHVVTASEDYKADIYIEGEQIVAIGKTQNTNATLTRRTNVGCRIERYAAQHQYIAQCSTKNAAGA